MMLVLAATTLAGTAGDDKDTTWMAGPTQTNLPLRVLADRAGLLIGVRAFLFNDAYKTVVAREFNTGTRTCYPNEIDRHPGQHDLEGFNTGVNWFYERGMKPLHHMLFGPSMYEAEWVRKITSAAELESLMQERLKVIMESNGNASKVYSWNVVNEAFQGDGRYFGEDYLVWARMGYEEDRSGLAGDDRINDRHPVFIRKAFELAGQRAKGKLELRENGCEAPGNKARALYQLVRHLQRSGVRIDAVGLQCHFDLDGNQTLHPEGLASEIRRYRKIGVEVFLDEVDFGRGKQPWTRELAEKQKQDYKQLIAVALKEGVSQVHFWGLCDGDEQWRGDENPLLLGKGYTLKPAYFGVREALLEFRGNGTRAGAPKQDQ